MTMRWQGEQVMLNNCNVYADKVVQAARAVADYFAPVMVQYAKQNASWVDRTANARQTLHSWVEELANDVVALYLSHGVYYGIFLEAKWAGRYAIIWPTIQQHLEQITQMLQGIFS